MTETPILEGRNLSKAFLPPRSLAQTIARMLGASEGRRGVHAVSDVSLAVQKGEVLGLVGESGCGKSTLGRILSGVLSPSSGQVRYRGQTTQDMNAAERKAAALKIQMIFQNPYASLNPRIRVGNLIGEAPTVHGLIDRSERDDFLSEILQRVGLDPSYLDRFPHQLSGGQRQRIGIARALAVDPEVLVCDESVAALDVSSQAQILNLFMRLREELQLTYVFISHDLGVVYHVSDRVAIVYLGRVVEIAPTVELYGEPNHPYTRALLGQVTRLHDRRQKYTVIKGEMPSPLSPPTGCHFHPRCPMAMPRCKTETPVLREIGPGHLSSCHLNDQ